jgi:hypothetical protein
MKKWRHFVNTIAPWPVPVRQSLQNLQGAEHSSWLLQVKNEDDNQKKLIANGN